MNIQIEDILHLSIVIVDKLIKFLEMSQGIFCGVRFSDVLEQDMIPCLVLVHPRKTCHSMTEKMLTGM